MTAEKLSRYLKPALIATALIFVPAAAYDLYLEFRFSEYPRHPTPATAQVVPYFWKTVTIYVSSSEANVLAAVHAVSLWFLFVLATYLATRVVARRSNR